MQSILFYAAVVLLMPGLTVIVVDHAAGGGLASMIGFAVALACVLLSFALAQVAAIATGLLRLARKLVGREQNVEAPPSTVERFLFAAGPVSAALTLYTLAGLGLSFWTESGAAIFVVKMVALGGIYGALMAYGLLRRLADPHDVDALGAYGVADEPVETKERARR